MRPSPIKRTIRVVPLPTTTPVKEPEREPVKKKEHAHNHRNRMVESSSRREWLVCKCGDQKEVVYQEPHWLWR